eukprot:scaffold30537_cov123-Isochrysis_galbana.AAC.2
MLVLAQGAALAWCAADLRVHDAPIDLTIGCAQAVDISCAPSQGEVGSANGRLRRFTREHRATAAARVEGQDLERFERVDQVDAPIDDERRPILLASAAFGSLDLNAACNGARLPISRLAQGDVGHVAHLEVAPARAMPARFARHVGQRKELVPGPVFWISEANTHLPCARPSAGPRPAAAAAAHHAAEGDGRRLELTWPLGAIGIAKPRHEALLSRGQPHAIDRHGIVIAVPRRLATIVQDLSHGFVDAQRVLQLRRNPQLRHDVAQREASDVHAREGAPEAAGFTALRLIVALPLPRACPQVPHDCAFAADAVKALVEADGPKCLRKRRSARGLIPQRRELVRAGVHRLVAARIVLAHHRMRQRRPQRVARRRDQNGLPHQTAFLKRQLLVEICINAAVHMHHSQPADVGLFDDSPHGTDLGREAGKRLCYHCHQIVVMVFRDDRAESTPRPDGGPPGFGPFALIRSRSDPVQFERRWRREPPSTLLELAPGGRRDVGERGRVGVEHLDVVGAFARVVRLPAAPERRRSRGRREGGEDERVHVDERVQMHHRRRRAGVGQGEARGWRGSLEPKQAKCRPVKTPFHQSTTVSQHVF